MPLILAVDDEPSVRGLVKRLLEPAGYTVLLAENADEALKLLAKSNSPAVAVCDMHMPGKTGVWLAGQIREVSPTTAIVLATADARLPPSETFRPGIVAYILKPFDRAQFLDAVHDAVLWSQQETSRAAHRA